MNSPKSHHSKSIDAACSKLPASSFLHIPRTNSEDISIGSKNIQQSTHVISSDSELKSIKKSTDTQNKNLSNQVKMSTHRQKTQNQGPVHLIPRVIITNKQDTGDSILEQNHTKNSLNEQTTSNVDIESSTSSNSNGNNPKHYPIEENTTNEQDSSKELWSCPKKFFRTRHKSPTKQIPTANKFNILNENPDLIIEDPTPPEQLLPEEIDTTSSNQSHNNNEDTDARKQTNSNKNSQNSLGNKKSRFQSIGSFYIDKTTITNPTGIIKFLQAHCQKPLFAQITTQALILRPGSIDDHNTIEKMLSNTRNYTELAFYFHRATPERRYKLMIRGLDINMNCEELRAEIQASGIKVHHLSELKRKSIDNKLVPLGIYAIEFNHNQITELKNIKYLAHYKVQFEEPKDKHRIPFCVLCASWGHTKNGCRRPPRCMGCAGDHSSINCPITDKLSTKPKCANCAGDHPANYSECRFHLEAKLARQQQLEKLKQSRERQIIQNQRNKNISSITDFPHLTKATNTKNPPWFNQDNNDNKETTQNPENTENLQTLSNQSTIGEFKELLDTIKGLNLRKIIAGIKTVINIFKQPGDITTKAFTALETIATLF